MKNKKSPLKFVGAAMGLAGAAAGTNHFLGRLGGLFGGGSSNADRHTGVGGLVGGDAAIGSRPANIVDAGSQFDPTAMSAMQGIFGDVTGRQASLGASGIYALKKHLSPLKNEDNKDEKPLYTEAQWHAVGSVTDAAIKKGAGAYIEVPKGDSYEDPDYYDNLSSEELERKFPKAGDKNK